MVEPINIRYIALEDSDRCDAAAMLGVQDLDLEKVAQRCNLCLAKISSRMTSVACAELAREKDAFVCCRSCFDNKFLMLDSRDFARLGPHKSRRKAYHSFSLRLRNRMLCYAPFPMIGRFDSLSSKFVYTTYGEAYDMARKLATTLLIVLGEQLSSEVVCVRCINEVRKEHFFGLVFLNFCCFRIF